MYYGSFRAVRDVNLTIRTRRDHGVHRPVRLRQDHGAALLQPDERPHRHGAGSRARCCYHGVDLYGSDVSAAEVRRRIGMVFQKPNPFPKSIYDNVAFGPRINGVRKKSELDDIVEQSLRGAALWDEVKDRLKTLGPRPVGRPAAAAVHRPGHRRRARGHPDGRAVLGARPDRHRPHRGADAGDQGRGTRS